MKTNAVRLLDVKKIPYEMVNYKINKDNYDAEQIANGVPTMANDFTLTFLSEFAIGKVDVRCGKSVRLLKL